MMTYGMSITAPQDPLKKVQLDRVLDKIKHPSEKLEEQIRQLRILKSLDHQSYRKQKTQLPYFVCSIFHPLIRKKENFAAAQYMVIDIDHCGQKNISTEVLKDELSDDPNIRGIFVSPGGDGLKVIFELDERITDLALYSIAYKNYLMKFAQKYALEDLVDYVTHDVTRACFFSVDREAWINTDAAKLPVRSLLEEPSVEEIFSIEKRFKEEADKRDINKVPTEAKVNMTDDTLEDIKSRLFPKKMPKKEKNVFVPEVLQGIGERLNGFLSLYNMKLGAEEPIHYGKKLRIVAGNHFAEINLFYGQKGYSIVKTTKTGSNSELADLAYKAIELFIEENQN